MLSARLNIDSESFGRAYMAGDNALQVLNCFGDIAGSLGKLTLAWLCIGPSRLCVGVRTVGAQQLGDMWAAL